MIGIYFYLPPADTDLVPQVSEEVFLGALTAYGAARLVGGLFDSLADPFVGWGSDRSRSPLGRRRAYLVVGIAPMVLAPVLLFWPPGEPGSTLTFVWLTGLLALYYVFFTVYVAPYLALIPELARSQEQRLSLMMLMAAVGFPILGLYGPGWLLGVQLGRELGLSGTEAVRMVVLVSAGVAFVLCLLPILAVDERRFAHSIPNSMSLGEALGTTLRNRPFLIYLLAQLPFILGINMIGPLVPYLSVVALGRDEGFAGLLSLAGAAPALIGFLVVGRVVGRIGPKRTVIGCVLLLGLLSAALGLLRPDAPGGPDDARNLAIAIAVLGLAGLPLAGFLVVPNVIIGQLVDLDEARTGTNRSAMYFGAQGLLTKWVYAASAALLSYLLLEHGNSREEPDGVLLAGPVAGAFCVLSALLYTCYPEQAVRAEAAAARTHTEAG